METIEAQWVSLIENRLAELSQETDANKTKITELENRLRVFEDDRENGQRLSLNSGSAYFSDFWSLRWVVHERGVGMPRGVQIKG